MPPPPGSRWWPWPRVWLWPLLLLVGPALGQPPVQTVMVAVNQASLLSGSLTSCVNVTAPTCVGGLASAAALVRHWRAARERVVYLPNFDHASPFVQMIDLQWSVNIPIFEHFNYTQYWGTVTVMSDHRTANLGLLQTNVTFTLANIWMPATSLWLGYSTRAYLQERVALFPVCDETQAYCDPVIPSVQATVLDCWRRYGPDLDLTVLLHDQASDPVTLAAAVTQMDNPPDIVLLSNPPASLPLGLVNRTYFVDFSYDDTHFSRLLVNYTMDAPPIGGYPRATLLSVTVDSVSLTALPAAVMDGQYYADQAYLAGLAAQAVQDDPVVGLSAAPMPPTRPRAGTNVCYAGECPMGDLWTDAFRWAAGADLAVTAVGGIRGPGWPAGPIHVSDLWAAWPFADTLCTATLLGLSIWELVNRSFALATFTTAVTLTGDRLLQFSGARVSYNPDLEPDRGRAIAIDIYDAASNAYRPLDRLALYTIAADDYTCSAFDKFPVFFSGRFAREVGAVVGLNNVHDVMGSYLTAASPVTPGTDHRMNVSASTASMDWLETLATCPADTMFVADIATCMPCPAGQYQPTPGSASCLPEPPPSLLPIVLPVVAGVLLLVAVPAAAALWIHRKHNVRDLANAPTEGPVTLIFTDIQDSTRLWGNAPESMARALDEHHRLIRACIARHRGYEVKTVGDSFMIAIKSPQAGLALALDIQLALQEQPFPKAIAEVYGGDLVEEVDDNPEELAPLHPLWNGLRVRIGVHTGTPDCVFDEVTKGYDYYGPPVNVAARIEGVARGGQIVVSQAVLDAVELDPERTHATPLGPVPLKGVAQPVPLHQVLPRILIERGLEYTKAPKGRQPSGVFSEAGGDHAASGVISDSGTAVTGVHRNVNDLLVKHPLVRQRVMTVEQVESAMHEIAQALLATLRLVPRKAGDGMVAAIARAWRLREERTREATLQMVALRVIPTLGRYRLRAEAMSSLGVPSPTHAARAASVCPSPCAPGPQRSSPYGKHTSHETFLDSFGREASAGPLSLGNPDVVLDAS